MADAGQRQGQTQSPQGQQQGEPWQQQGEQGQQQGELGQQQGQMQSQPPGRNVMSAEQIISILEQEPDALDTIKQQLAQRSAVDPSTISDEALYEQLRQEASVRLLATIELTKRGFSLDVTMINSDLPGGNQAAGNPAPKALPLSRRPTRTPTIRRSSAGLVPI